MIKAVIFDVDGVLVDSFEANHKFFADLMAKFGYAFMQKEEFASFFHVPMKDIIKHSTKSINETEIEKIWKSGKDRDVPYPDELLNTPANLNKVIKSLSKNYILGIVTSRARSGIYSLPQLKILKNYFSEDVAYEDTKNHKPHPDPLLLISKKLKIPPQECVYVGDSESDMIAARAAGMKCIMYSKKINTNVDANVSSFSELPQVLQSI